MLQDFIAILPCLLDHNLRGVTKCIVGQETNAFCGPARMFLFHRNKNFKTCPEECSSIHQWWCDPLQGSLWVSLITIPETRAWPSLLTAAHLPFWAERKWGAFTPCSWFWFLDYTDPTIIQRLQDDQRSRLSAPKGSTCALKVCTMFFLKRNQQVWNPGSDNFDMYISSSIIFHTLP